MAYSKRPRDLKTALKGVLTPSEMKVLKKSFDSLGTIAVIEIPPELEKKEHKIGRALMDLNPRIETVCKKTGPRKGKYRIQPLKIIAGKRNKIATYKENGCTFLVPLEKVFFSPRLSTERERIARQIRQGETVAVFFAGVGPFSIVCARQAAPEKVYAIELNPAGISYLKKNIALNKQEGKVIPLHGDVKVVVPTHIPHTCDRVVMPLPKDAGLFWGEAFSALKPEGGMIHFYTFAEVKHPFEQPVREATEAARQHGKTAVIREARVTRSYSPDITQVVLDVHISPLPSAQKKG